MQRTTLATLALIVVALISASGCLPLAGFTPEGYTTDVSRMSEGALVVGHCFRLLVEVYTPESRKQIELRGGGAVEVYGRLRVIGPPGSTLPARFGLPKGSRIVVERVLAWRSAENSSLTPYIRIDGVLVDAGELFQVTGRHPYRVMRDHRLLERCDPKDQ